MSKLKIWKYPSKTPRTTPPESLIFVNGYASVVEGSRKPMFLRNLNLPVDLILYDHYGHGQSPGTLIDGTIDRWSSDLINIVKTETMGSVFLVGSSMGVWLSLLAAQDATISSRVKGILGINASIDFTTKIRNSMTSTQSSTAQALGYHTMPSQYFDSLKFGWNLLNSPPPPLNYSKITAAVTLIASRKDQVTDWKTNSQTIQNHLSSNLVLLPSADHRCSSEADLAIIKQFLNEMIGIFQVP